MYNLKVLLKIATIYLHYRDDSKKQIGRQMELAGADVTDQQLEDMLEGGGGAQLMGHIQIEGDAEQLKSTLNDIESRHEMFQNLEKNITELHEMFVDIATLVEAQGEMINRIDVHVGNAVDFTDRAMNDTKKALEYAQKARRKKIMMLLCVIIGGPLAAYMGLKYLGMV